MRNLFKVTREDILNLKNRSKKSSEQNKPYSNSITVAKLTATEINAAWSVALKKCRSI